MCVLCQGWVGVKVSETLCTRGIKLKNAGAREQERKNKKKEEMKKKFLKKLE